MAKYRMLADSKVNEKVKAGATVYDQRGYDYGLARDDTRATGVEHITVTLNADGDYPGFTVPVTALEKVQE